jgi:hypothetical protein
MDAISDTLSNTAISTVFSKENLDQYLWENKIGEAAFDRCWSLTSITIPNNVTEIGTQAFMDCGSLRSINIPASVTEIGEAVFLKCFSLTSITIPGNVTKIGIHTFSDCSSLTSITIPHGVTEIGKRVFFRCTNLINITIPGSVTKIGELAFAHCTNLKSISIPDAVTKIGPWAFLNGSSLTSITIPDGVTEIGKGAFEECTSLTLIICNNPGQFNWENIGINNTQTQFISHEHAKLLTANNLTDLNHNEAYLIYRLISELEFNPSWEVLETTFNERSFEQVRELLINLKKNIDHLPEKIISFRRSNITHPLSPFLTIAERNSLFGQAQRNINIRAPKKAQETPAAQQQFPRGV